MKIYNGSEIKQLIPVQKKTPSETSQKTTSVKNGDKVDFSEELQKIQDMENRFSTNSDREARLREVKEQISNGTYKPDPQKVATSLLKYIVEGNGDG